MKPQLFSAKLLVKKSPIHGYGVFADQDLVEGQIIEECHPLFFKDDTKSFMNYVFDVEGKKLLLLGHGSLYNHSDDPNTHHEYDPEHNIVTFQATRFIKQGEELFVSYGSAWFSFRKMRKKEASLRFKLKKLLSFALLLTRGAIVGSIFIILMVLAHHSSFSPHQLFPKQINSQK